MPALSRPKLYNLRHPERTLLYQTVAAHYETWLELASAGQFDGQGDCRTPKPDVRKAFAKYLECGIFAHGFARARCGDFGHAYFVAFSWPRRARLGSGEAIDTRLRGRSTRQLVSDQNSDSNALRG